MSDLRRLAAAAHEATAHIDSRSSAVQLYLDASAVAEERIPGPLGVAVAAVLAMAAHERSLALGTQGSLGASRPAMALVLAVLEADLIPDMPDVTDEALTDEADATIPVRVTVGDLAPQCVGWIERGPCGGRRVAALLRAAADEMDAAIDRGADAPE